MTELTTVDADRELKSRHRAMWALGDYPAVAAEVVGGLGPVLVDAVRIRPGDRVLDVAAGSGNASIPAAKRGAHVVASDLTPELFGAGQQRADAHGVTVDWQEADAEALPFDDDAFDAVLSCLGVMFAPHHQRSADELLRVTRPGGALGLLSWTPEGFIGQMFAAMKPFAPAPPPGAQPPPLWGNEEHLTGLLGDRVEDLSLRRGYLPVDRFLDGADFRDYFKQRYGPTIATYRGIAHDEDLVGALDEDLAELGDRNRADGNGTMQWEYLLFTARRR